MTNSIQMSKGWSRRSASQDLCVSTLTMSTVTFVFHYQKNQSDKKTAAGLKDLQEELERRAEECKRLREKLAKTEAELQTTVEE